MIESTMESQWLAVISICGVIALGAITPGQSFILVARTTMASSLWDGIATAAGMGAGCAIFALIALLGLHSLLVAVPWLYAALKTAGGVYLLYLALKMLFCKSTPLLSNADNPVAATTLWRAFRVGLLTQISNPNTAIVFGSVFAALLTRHITPVMFLVLPALAFMIDFVWYAFVACVLSMPAPRAIYLTFRTGFDRMAGMVLAGLGLKLIFQR